MTEQTITQQGTVRVLVALDVPVDQSGDLADLVASIEARVEFEAGYLDDGSPVTPTRVVIAVVDDETALDGNRLRYIYQVGADF